jgi:RNA-binding protein YhbY
MKSTKIKVAFAEDNEDHRKRIINAICETENFEVSIKAASGRDLILQLT